MEGCDAGKMGAAFTVCRLLNCPTHPERSQFKQLGQREAAARGVAYSLGSSDWLSRVDR